VATPVQLAKTSEATTKTITAKYKVFPDFLIFFSP
jgi:hypothetical protein